MISVQEISIIRLWSEHRHCFETKKFRFREECNRNRTGKYTGSNVQLSRHSVTGVLLYWRCNRHVYEVKEPGCLKQCTSTTRGRVAHNRTAIACSACQIITKELFCESNAMTVIWFSVAYLDNCQQQIVVALRVCQRKTGKMMRMTKQRAHIRPRNSGVTDSWKEAAMQQALLDTMRKAVQGCCNMSILYSVSP